MRLLLLLVAITSVAAPARATLTIDLNYVTPVSPAVEAIFTSAKSTWEGLLQGYQDGAIVGVSAGSSYVGQPLFTPLTSVFIDVNVAPIDGVGMVLGSAGPNAIAEDSTGFILTTDGQMTFDDADANNLITNGTFGDVVLHEMAHVLGFGTLWTDNSVYNTGSGEYTGANALSYWQSEFGQTGALFVDVELGGGPGTANGHWNEVDNGAGLTGITDGTNDLRNELMTGWLNGPTFISDMTIASFQDIGFVAAAIPEAGSFLALGLVFIGAATGRRAGS